MKKTYLISIAAGILLLVAPTAAPVRAIGAIQRCESDDGIQVYTDRACKSLDAKPVPMPDGLATRLVREASVSASFDGAQTVRYADAATPLDVRDSNIGVSRRSPGSGCARTPTQLAMDLRGALVLGDVNRVAESYDWAGMSNQQGQRTLDRLQHLIGRPVVESRYYNAQITSSPFAGQTDAMATATASADAGGGVGILQLTLGNSAQASVVDFDVHRDSGCYFVRF